MLKKNQEFPKFTKTNLLPPQFFDTQKLTCYHQPDISGIFHPFHYLRPEFKYYLLSFSLLTAGVQVSFVLFTTHGRSSSIFRPIISHGRNSSLLSFSLPTAEVQVSFVLSFPTVGIQVFCPFHYPRPEFKQNSQVSLQPRSLSNKLTLNLFDNSVCFSPDCNTLASGSYDNSIRLWEVKTEKEIQSSNKSYKDILAQFTTQLFQNNPLQESISTNITILLISQQTIFQAQGALILKGEFVNQLGIDLKTLFKQKGSCILENQVELQQK